MSDIVVHATLDTTALGTLKIDDKTDATVPYSLVRGGIGPGGLTWRKTTVTSPFVSGRVVVHEVKDAVPDTLKVRVRGSTTDWLDYYIYQLTQYFESFNFRLTLNVDGVVHSWNCESADWAVGDAGAYQDMELRSHTQIVTASFMRDPIPLVGRF